MLEQLQKLLKQKKSKAFYAEKLGISVEEVQGLLQELNKEEELTIDGPQTIGLDKYQVSAFYDHPPTPEEVIADHKIDLTKYTMSSYYSKGKNGGWHVTALFKSIKEEDKVLNDFQEFLKTYEGRYKPQPKVSKDITGSPGSLVLNKQDFHANKRDEYLGENDIFDRFESYEQAINKTLWRASRLVDLDRTTYIIGSDHFNSEVTGMTVKGTPQSNILNYQTSFQLVCDHEVDVINQLLSHSDTVEVIYLIGNHDACVSFHMASWLKVYFRDEMRLKVDISSDFTKYFSLYDTAFCINHGDVQKPERLAQNFPLEYKKGFADANHHAIVTGDKHVELTRDIGGIKFYQIPALSKARGTWDKQMGYTTTPAQMTSFLVEPGNGISTILKETL